MTLSLPSSEVLSHSVGTGVITTQYRARFFDKEEEMMGEDDDDDES
jgi:hypothetical protein